MHAFEVESFEKHGNDTVFEIKILADRAHDALGHYFIAKELGAILNKPVKEIVHKKHTTKPVATLRVAVSDEKECPRYMARVIENISVGESPAWLKNYLESVGQRSINNLVDAGNFIMLSFNQPIHIFDRDKLNGKSEKEIRVRLAKAGEILETLDGQEISLTEDTLLIADSKDPLVIAGIKGGKKGEVTNTTKNIIIESANFNSISVRKAAQKIGVRTDSSKRFENGLSPKLVELGMNVVTDLIVEIAGTTDTKIGEVVDVYPKKQGIYKIGVSVSEVNRRLGTNMSQKDIEDILKRFGFSYGIIKNPRKHIVELSKKLEGTPYVYGASITRDAPQKFDCSSFTAYLYREAGFGIPRMVVDQYVYGDEAEQKDMTPGDLIFANTGNLKRKIPTESVECLPGTKVPNGVDHVGLYVGDGMVIHGTEGAGKVIVEKLTESTQFKNIAGVRCFITSDEERFVVTIPPERLDLRNQGSFLAGGTTDDLIEEVGRIYGYENIKEAQIPATTSRKEINKTAYYESKLRDIFAEQGFSEVYTSSFSARGDVELENPVRTDRAYVRKNLSDNLREIMPLNAYNKDLLGISDVRIFEIGTVFTKDGEHKSCAFIGSGIEKEILEKIGQGIAPIKDFVEKEGVIEFNFTKLIENLPTPQKYDERPIPTAVLYKKPSQYPFVLRDIAVFIPKSASSEKIIDIVKKHAGDLLVTHKLFDVFEKGEETSYAHRIVFQSRDTTLSDAEINKIMEAVTTDLNGQSGWRVR